MRCNCEASYCGHTHVGDTRCSNVSDGTHVMEYVGPVCDTCAQRVIANGGGAYLHLGEVAV